MDAWADGILSKVQTILKGHDPWAAPPRPPSPLRAETPPPAESWAAQSEQQRDEEEEDLFGERTGEFTGAEPVTLLTAGATPPIEEQYSYHPNGGYAMGASHEEMDELEGDGQDEESEDDSVIVLGDSEDEEGESLGRDEDDEGSLDEEEDDEEDREEEYDSEEDAYAEEYEEDDAT